MSRVLYIHIGNYKTGTSSIQRFCHENARSLKESGLHYFESCRPERIETNHGRLSLELIKKYGGHLPKWYIDDYSFESAVEEIKQEIHAHDDTDFLISSEAFFRLVSLESGKLAIQLLKDSFDDLDIDIKIIMYVREPLAFLASWYNQLTKESRSPTRTFNDFVNEIQEFHVDPYVNYNAWLDVFGEKNIIVKEYQYKGDEHLQDFLRIMIQNFDRYSNTDNAIVNVGLSSTQLEVKRVSKIVNDYSSNRINKKIGLNAYVNSDVLQDAGTLRSFSQRVDLIYKKNHEFYVKFFDKNLQEFDVFNIISQSANLNYIDLRTFWRSSPSIGALIDKAVSIKGDQPQLALELFEVAKKSRPSGKFIQKNIEELSAMVDKS